MRIALLLVCLLALSGCPPLNAAAVEACGKTCGDRGVASVDGNNCFCRNQ